MKTYVVFQYSDCNMGWGEAYIIGFIKDENHNLSKREVLQKAVDLKMINENGFVECGVRDLLKDDIINIKARYFAAKNLYEKIAEL